MPLDFLSQHEETLKNTVITNESPGSILHDFQVLLDFVAEATPQLTNAQILPMKVLEPLNEQLTRRIQHGLTRPQQKSYPHINGLFLLLRATGLTLVDAGGRKPMLLVDPLVQDSWNKLTPEDRYFTLLESWLLRGDSAIIGERGGYLQFQPPLYLWVDFFQRLEQKNWHEGDWIERVRYWPALHNLALMELFGLVEIDDAPSEAQKGWQIADIRTTAWGEALLSLINSLVPLDSEVWDKLASPQDIQPGELQPFIQLFRPEWQQTLHLPTMEFQDGLYVFKVSLDANVWRQITMPATSTLDDLSDAILDAYKFDDDHLYRFLYPTRFGLTTEVFHPYTEIEPFADEVRIGDLPAQPGFQMIFNYDFGDNWHFNVLLERIEPPNPNASRYKIGKRVGKSPEQYPSWEY